MASGFAKTDFANHVFFMEKLEVTTIQFDVVSTANLEMTQSLRQNYKLPKTP
jgi:hypothetical protein